jgi:hypothetical protein
MLFTGCGSRMRKTVPEVLKTARARRARASFKTEGTVFLIRTDAASKYRVYFLSDVKLKFIKIAVLLAIYFEITTVVYF